MISRSQRGPVGPDAWLILGLLWAWPLLGGLIWLGTLVAGGHPSRFWDWPLEAVRLYLGPDRRTLLPWHWMGASSVTSPGLFWTAAGALAGGLGLAGLGLPRAARLLTPGG